MTWTSNLPEAFYSACGARAHLESPSNARSLEMGVKAQRRPLNHFLRGRRLDRPPTALKTWLACLVALSHTCQACKSAFKPSETNGKLFGPVTEDLRGTMLHPCGPSARRRFALKRSAAKANVAYAATPSALHKP
jgi:hypothetical protein